MALGIKHRAVYLMERAKLAALPDALPVWHYYHTPNAGDALNLALLPQLTSHRIVAVKSEKIPHVRAIGSILDHAPVRSITWGSGLIHPSAPQNQLDPDCIRAVRGHLTRQIVEDAFGCSGVPVGDPAVLASRYLGLRPTNRYLLGIVPHYVDAPIVRSWKKAIPPEILVIDVAAPPRSFISNLIQCEAILSSSLHGLILSDAFNIPNAWVRFSDLIKGGDFKFRDYYTTTDAPKKTAIDVTEAPFATTKIRTLQKACSVAAFAESMADLLSSFPSPADLRKFSNV